MNQAAMDRWTTVKHIHQSALDRDPSERAAFVDESCGGDETLRREVQSLLTYATDAESFLERPAVDVAPTGPSAPGETALVGRTVSHYQVLSLLGAGGMGEVYLARDPRLDRTVALKILPGDLAVDPGRMLRFTREAQHGVRVHSQITRQNLQGNSSIQSRVSRKVDLAHTASAE